MGALPAAARPTPSPRQPEETLAAALGKGKNGARCRQTSGFELTVGTDFAMNRNDSRRAFLKAASGLTVGLPLARPPRSAGAAAPRAVLRNTPETLVADPRLSV